MVWAVWLCHSYLIAIRRWQWIEIYSPPQLSIAFAVWSWLLHHRLIKTNYTFQCLNEMYDCDQIWAQNQTSIFEHTKPDTHFFSLSLSLSLLKTIAFFYIIFAAFCCKIWLFWQFLIISVFLPLKPQKLILYSKCCMKMTHLQTMFLLLLKNMYICMKYVIRNAIVDTIEFVCLTWKK